VLVDGAEAFVGRRRETYADLIRGERALPGAQPGRGKAGAAKVPRLPRRPRMR